MSDEWASIDNRVSGSIVSTGVWRERGAYMRAQGAEGGEWWPWYLSNLCLAPLRLKERERERETERQRDREKERGASLHESRRARMYHSTQKTSMYDP